jgi:hypothetical protein
MGKGAQRSHCITAPRLAHDSVDIDGDSQQSRGYESPRMMLMEDPTGINVQEIVNFEWKRLKLTTGLCIAVVYHQHFPR